MKNPGKSPYFRSMPSSLSKSFVNHAYRLAELELCHPDEEDRENLRHARQQFEDADLGMMGRGR